MRSSFNETFGYRSRMSSVTSEQAAFMRCTRWEIDLDREIEYAFDTDEPMLGRAPAGDVEQDRDVEAGLPPSPRLRRTRSSKSESGQTRLPADHDTT
jgi:hypothetical protein